MKAIPTKYRDLNRLEARWAELFTQFGWTWYYEPLDFDCGIPDFVVDHDYKPVLVDVKPYTSFGAVDEFDAKIRHALGRDLDNTASLSPGPTQWTMVMMSARELFGEVPYWDNAAILRPHKGSRVYGLSATDCGNYRDRITGLYDDDAGYVPLSQSEFMPFWHHAINATV